MVKKTVKCPKCEAISSDIETCINCGVVFAKYKMISIQSQPVTSTKPVSNKKNTKKAIIIVVLTILSCALIYWWLFTPDVKIYVEGTYTENEVQAHVYADVNVSCLKGFGVQLIYHPNQLTIESVVGNEDFLYLPDEKILSYNDRFGVTPYKLPVTSTPFQNIFFVGNIAAENCQKPDDCHHCISGKHILLGKVTFSRVENKMPFDPSHLFITFASGNNTSDPLRDFDKDIGRTSWRTGSSNVRLHGSDVKFGSIKFKEAL